MHWHLCLGARGVDCSAKTLMIFTPSQLRLWSTEEPGARPQNRGHCQKVASHGRHVVGSESSLCTSWRVLLASNGVISVAEFCIQRVMASYEDSCDSQPAGCQTLASPSKSDLKTVSRRWAECKPWSCNTARLCREQSRFGAWTWTGMPWSRKSSEVLKEENDQFCHLSWRWFRNATAILWSLKWWQYDLVILVDYVFGRETCLSAHFLGSFV